MIRSVLTAAITSLALTLPAMANPLAKDVFGAVPGPTAGQPSAVGFYSKGCLTGAAQLPETGPTWQAMRLSRNRNWGHPETINFLIGLSRAATQVGWRGLYIGDIGQPRGGPSVTGHASHQIGLDVDIWMLPPSSLQLTRQQRENLSSQTVVNRAGTGPSALWSPQHAAILRAAASDPRVDRIFVDPVAKVEMCRTATGDRSFLRKIRPLNGHDYHFHVRLKCPAGSSFCEGQTPPPAGDGCAEAAQWIQNRITPPKVTPKPDPNYRHPRTYRLSELPSQCTNIGLAR